MKPNCLSSSSVWRKEQRSLTGSEDDSFTWLGPVSPICVKQLWSRENIVLFLLFLCYNIRLFQLFGFIIFFHILLKSLKVAKLKGGFENVQVGGYAVGYGDHGCGCRGCVCGGKVEWLFLERLILERKDGWTNLKIGIDWWF